MIFVTRSAGTAPDKICTARRQPSPPDASRSRSAATTAASSPVRSARLVRASSRSEEHTSELQSLMRISYAVFCLKKKTTTKTKDNTQQTQQTQTREKNMSKLQD